MLQFRCILVVASLILFLCASSCCGFSRASKLIPSTKFAFPSPAVLRSTAHSFKKNDEDSGEGSSGNGENGKRSIWKGLKRFLPGVSRSKLKETYDMPSPDAGFRYEVRLVDVTEQFRRHTTTRIRRYIPDLSWDTATTMVEAAIEDGKSLIRVLNSREQTEELVIMLRRADPPVLVEVWDNKLEEVVKM